jgi:hypothetical protein
LAFSFIRRCAAEPPGRYPHLLARVLRTVPMNASAFCRKTAHYPPSRSDADSREALRDRRHTDEPTYAHVTGHGSGA